jgi:hypothetical protein
MYTVFQKEVLLRRKEASLLNDARQGPTAVIVFSDEPLETFHLASKGSRITRWEPLPTFFVTKSVSIIL